MERNEPKITSLPVQTLPKREAEREDDQPLSPENALRNVADLLKNKLAAERDEDQSDIGRLKKAWKHLTNVLPEARSDLRR